jgi:hypothetical protein
MLHKLGVAAVACSLVFAAGCGRKPDDERRPAPSPPAQQRAQQSTQPAPPPSAEPEKGAGSPAAAQPSRSKPAAPRPAPAPTAEAEKSAAPPTTAALPPSKPAAAAQPQRSDETSQPESGRPAAPPASTKTPPKPPAQAIVLAGAPMGGVRFEHAKHRVDCDTCHHGSREPRAASAPQQACTGFHTKPPQTGMKTGRQAAFHNPTATAGTCIDCHKRSGGAAPTRCMQCHKKENA